MISLFCRLLLVIVLLFANSAWSESGGLSGKWIQTYDPAKPVIGDWVQFRKSGDADLGDDKGVYLTCPYRMDGSTVVLNCTVRGKQKQLALTTQDSFRTLVNSTGSIYTRQ